MRKILDERDWDQVVGWYERMTPEKQRSFFQLTSGSDEKIVYLLRHGSFDVGRDIV